MKRPIWNLCLTTISIVLLANFAVAFDVETFIANFENKNDQTVLVGQIDSLSIIRGQFEFYLGQGELTLMDFGGGIPCAMVFKGKVHFIYSPPDEIERYQLHKFTGKDTLNNTFDDITFFYTIEIPNMPDTANFVRKKMTQKLWYTFRDLRDVAFKSLDTYLANNLLGDLISDGPGTFFYADFHYKKFDYYIFRENPGGDDQYRLYNLIWANGHHTYDCLAGHSLDDLLPSQRGVMDIDINHYDIDTKVETGDKMFCRARLQYTPLRQGRNYLRFYWFYKNKPILALDSNGDTLKVVHKEEAPGFGIVLNKPTNIGEEDYFDIEYESETLIRASGFYFNRGQAYWYPRNIFYDRATYSMSFKCIEDFTPVVSAYMIESKTEGGYNYSKWEQNIPVSIATFDLGLYDTIEFFREGLPPTRIFCWKFKTKYTKVEETGHDIIKSLEFFNLLFGNCPFDTIKVAEVPTFHGVGAPGLLHLSFLTTWAQISGNMGAFEQFRAHEVAHQWWGHIVDTDSYRDYWIIEGLAEYCGFIFYQSVFKNTKICENILSNWRLDINTTGSGYSIGSKAGPVVLGHRLSSSKSSDYGVLVYEKAAYIFHMIRYLFHNYGNDSDEAFIAFLKDILAQYKDRPIATEGLKSVLEEHTQTDMTWFFDQWIYGIYIPTYTFSYDTEKSPTGQFQVTCHVKQDNVPDDFKMVVPMTVVFEGDQFAHMKYWIDQPQMDIQLPPLPMKPKKIDFNIYDAVLCKVKYK